MKKVLLPLALALLGLSGMARADDSCAGVQIQAVTAYNSAGENFGTLHLFHNDGAGTYCARFDLSDRLKGTNHNGELHFVICEDHYDKQACYGNTRFGEQTDDGQHKVNFGPIRTSAKLCLYAGGTIYDGFGSGSGSTAPFASKWFCL